jgi:hypothetical protein
MAKNEVDSFLPWLIRQPDGLQASRKARILHYQEEVPALQEALLADVALA